MSSCPKISIVTPCLNASAHLRQTLDSVLEQGYPNLEYVVVDGGSQDQTPEILATYQAHLSAVIQEADEGLYHAINKGFRKTDGDIMAWLNADDRLLPDSLFAVAEVFSSFSDVGWITGVPVNIDAQGRLHESFHVSRWTRRKLLTSQHGSPQQESTFWRRSLWDKAGGQLDTRYRLAADYELWCRFFEITDLVSVRSLLAGFRRHGANLSVVNRNKYEAERGAIASIYRRRWNPRFVDRFSPWLKPEEVRAVFFNFEEKRYKLRRIRANGRIF